MIESRRVSQIACLALIASLPILASPSCAQTSETSLWVLWTAPGSDGHQGRASTYDLRYSSATVGSSIDVWWSRATRVSRLPAPSPAGASDSVLVTGLAPGTTYYFVLRVADEVPSWSGYSNVAVARTAGTAPVSSTTGTDAAEPALHAYPNPASGPVNFDVTVPGTGAQLVRLRVFNLNAQLVADLVNASYPPGTHGIVWNRKSLNGDLLTPGYYEVLGTIGGVPVRERILLVP